MLNNFPVTQKTTAKVMEPSISLCTMGVIGVKKVEKPLYKVIAWNYNMLEGFVNCDEVRHIRQILYMEHNDDN